MNFFMLELIIFFWDFSIVFLKRNNNILTKNIVFFVKYLFIWKFFYFLIFLFPYRLISLTFYFIFFLLFVIFCGKMLCLTRAKDYSSKLLICWFKNEYGQKEEGIPICFNTEYSKQIFVWVYLVHILSLPLAHFCLSSFSTFSHNSHPNNSWQFFW